MVLGDSPSSDKGCVEVGEKRGEGGASEGGD